MVLGTLRFVSTVVYSSQSSGSLNGFSPQLLLPLFIPTVVYRRMNQCFHAPKQVHLSLCSFSHFFVTFLVLESSYF
jgi:hypothetical protein